MSQPAQKLSGQGRLARLCTRPGGAGHHELPKANQLRKTSFVVHLYWLFGVLPGGAVETVISRCSGFLLEVEKYETKVRHIQEGSGRKWNCHCCQVRLHD
jgi:hypothetical protein